MEKQPRNPGGASAGDGAGTDAGTKAGTVALDVVGLRKDIKDLASHLKEIKDVLKQILRDKNNKIPGIK
jgi:hypothetical protein